MMKFVAFYFGAAVMLNAANGQFADIYSVIGELEELVEEGVDSNCPVYQTVNVAANFYGSNWYLVQTNKDVKCATFNAEELFNSPINLGISVPGIQTFEFTLDDGTQVHIEFVAVQDDVSPSNQGRFVMKPAVSLESSDSSLFIGELLGVYLVSVIKLSADTVLIDLCPLNVTSPASFASMFTKTGRMTSDAVNFPKQLQGTGYKLPSNFNLINLTDCASIYPAQ